MKLNELEVEKSYVVKLRGKIITVRITSIDKVDGNHPSPYSGFRKRNTTNRIIGINLITNRELTFRSATKFLRVANESIKQPM